MIALCVWVLHCSGFCHTRLSSFHVAEWGREALFFFLDAVLAFWPLMDRAGKTRLQISGEEIGCEFRK